MPAKFPSISGQHLAYPQHQEKAPIQKTSGSNGHGHYVPACLHWPVENQVVWRLYLLRYVNPNLKIERFNWVSITSCFHFTAALVVCKEANRLPKTQLDRILCSPSITVQPSNLNKTFLEGVSFNMICRRMYNPLTGGKCFGGKTGISLKPITDRICVWEKRGFKLFSALGKSVEVCVRPLR